MTGYSPLLLEKVAGETRLVGVKVGEHPDDQEDDDEESDDDETSPVRSLTSGSPRTVTERKIQTKTMSKLVKNTDATQSQIDLPVEQDPDARAAARKLESLRKTLGDNKI